MFKRIGKSLLTLLIVIFIAFFVMLYGFLIFPLMGEVTTDMMFFNFENMAFALIMGALFFAVVTLLTKFIVWLITGEYVEEILEEITDILENFSNKR